MLDHWQYLLVLTACLLITAPLEALGAGIYRQPRRLLVAVLPAAAIFLLWDAVAIGGHVWSYDRRYVLGPMLPGRIPIEEALFFLIIPLCGLLTYNAVTALLRRPRAASTDADADAPADEKDPR